MQALRVRGLADFDKRSAGIITLRADNLAVTPAGYKVRENHDTVTDDVSSFRLVKDRMVCRGSMIGGSSAALSL